MKPQTMSLRIASRCAQRFVRWQWEGARDSASDETLSPCPTPHSASVAAEGISPYHGLGPRIRVSGNGEHLTRGEGGGRCPRQVARRRRVRRCRSTPASSTTSPHTTFNPSGAREPLRPVICPSLRACGVRRELGRKELQVTGELQVADAHPQEALPKRDNHGNQRDVSSWGMRRALAGDRR